MNIIHAGYVALEATHNIIIKEKPALKCRFSNRFLSLTDEMTGRETLTRDSIIEMIKKSRFDVNDECIVEISDTGIFGTLWEMAEQFNTGLSIDLNKISIRQETIEICEWADINPYTYPSRGSFLIRTENAYEIRDFLSSNGIKVSVIGYETNDNKRIIVNQDEIRYLTPIDRLLSDEKGHNNLRY